MSIIKELGGLVTSQIISQAAKSLGESESGIGKVIGSLAPTILAGLLNKSSDTGAFGQIFDMLGKKENVSYLDNLGGLIGGGNLAHNDPKDAAGSLLGSLFGDKVGGILDMVSSIAGVNKSSSSSLMGMVGPMIMGYLGKKILNGGLSASGLAGLLSSEKDNIAEAIPNQLAEFIGFDVPDTTVADKAAAAATTVKHEAAKATKTVETAAKTGGNNLLKYLLPLLLLAGAFFAWKSCGADVKDAGNAAIEKAGNAASAASDMATKSVDAVSDAAGDAVSGLGSFLSKSLPGGISLNVPERGIESQLLSFIEGSEAVDKETWFNFDRLNFATGSANLDMDKSKEQLDNIAAIMKAYPNVNVKIGGYTDNTGNAANNMTLSANRAKNVMAALTGLGVAADRMDAEGYGDAHPVASNDTEEGRAQNRRIALRVTKK